MKVVFKTTCVTTFGKYVKGRTYDLQEEQAKQFIKEGLGLNPTLIWIWSLTVPPFKKLIISILIFKTLQKAPFSREVFRVF
jgi:hypothetical protein